MSESRECRAIKKCASDLEKVLEFRDRSFVYLLHNKGFITQQVCDEVLNPKSQLRSEEKAGELVKGIRNAVSTNPGHYYQIFVGCLKDQKDEKYDTLLSKLNREYCPPSDPSKNSFVGS